MPRRPEPVPPPRPSSVPREEPSAPLPASRGEELFDELEQLPLAMLLVGAGCSLLFANRSARSLLGACDPLYVDGQQLRCLDRPSEGRLSRAVDACIQAARVSQQEKISVDLASRRHALEAVVVASTRGAGRPPAALVMVRPLRRG